ncbi:MAG: hypothetical protein U0798_15110 [Gemmataceae bacterium]
MWVKLARPQWDRSCADCRKFIYEENGQRKLHKRTGLPVLNPSGLTPCASCEKVPAHVFDEQGIEIPKTNKNANRLREQAVELTARIARAWWHYRTCRAVGRFPDDHVVRANAVLFREVEDQAAEDQRERRDARWFELILAALPKR